MDHLAGFGGVASIIARGDTKMSLRLAAGVQVDLRAVPAESFGAALQYFTGSKEHNIVLRGRAKAQGLKINEYGVFRGEKQIAGRTEEEVYATLGPALLSARAARGPAGVRLGRRRRAARAGRAGRHPRRPAHAQHVDRRHGDASRRWPPPPKQRGLKYIAITDHSKRVTMVGGLDAEPAAAAMGRNRQAQRAAQRNHRPQGRRGRHSRTRRAGPARRRAGRGRLGRGQRPLRPAAVARADHRAG